MTAGAGGPAGGATAPFVYQCFSLVEARFVEALVDVMCPADDLTPRGVDVGLAIYMDRQLAGVFGKGARMYMRGPWRQGKPQHGPQLPLTPAQVFKAGIAAAQEVCVRARGVAFEQLSATDADAFLIELASGKVEHPTVALAAWFNDLVYPLFVEGCFADPIYGGNRDKAFWKLIGYPGLPARYASDVVTYRGKPYPRTAPPKSIGDV